jgi:GT2 family glycosyltransferase
MTENTFHTRLTCAVMITTHNRLEDLQHTCRQLRQLDPAPDEWLFTADGCTDGTAEWLRHEFPEAILFVNDPGQGSVPSRDRMLRETGCELVLSLDDDSYPLDSNALQVLEEFFSSNPKVAIASLPQRTDEYPETHGQEDFGNIHPVGSYSSCAVCLRREAYLSTEGYPHFFFHIYEEPDFTLQALDSGWEAIWFPHVVIRHHYSPVGRNELSIHQRHSRNECWSALMRCPSPWMPLILLGKTASQARYAARRGWDWLCREPGWWFQALAGAPKVWRHRRPVRRESYRAWLRAMRKGS